MKADTTTVVFTDGPPPSPTALGDARAAVLKKFAKPDTVQITNTRLKGDSAWVTVRHSPSTWTTYTVVNRRGVWTIVREGAGVR